MCISSSEGLSSSALGSRVDRSMAIRVVVCFDESGLLCYLLPFVFECMRLASTNSIMPVLTAITFSHAADAICYDICTGC